jgi:hypothetical protein
MDCSGNRLLLFFCLFSRLASCRFSYLLGLATRRIFRLYGESFSYHRLNQLNDNRAKSYHYQIQSPLIECLDLISNWITIRSLQPMQESPGEPTTARTNVYICLFIQKTSWSTSNVFLTRYRSGGTANKSQPQDACELQGRQIEALDVPALVLSVNTHRWVLADNSYQLVIVKILLHVISLILDV